MSLARRGLRKTAVVVLAMLEVSAVPKAANAARKLSLADAIALAKDYRSEARQSELDIKLAKNDVLRAGLQRVRLTANVSYSDGYQKQNLGSPASPAECQVNPSICPTDLHEQLFVATANLSVPIWSGLSVESSWSRAHKLEDAAEAHRKSSWRSVALDTASAYWAVRRAELLLEANTRAFERSSKIVTITKARTDAGIAPVTDFMRAQSSMFLDQATLSDTRGQADDARAQLASALQIDEAIQLTEDPIDRPVVLPALADVVADAERRRPEIQGAQLTFEAQEKQVQITAGGFWPQISLFGSADARNQLLGIQQTSLIGSYSAGVKVDWQIFDSLTTYTQLRQDQLTATRMDEDRRRLTYTVRAEVQAAYGHLKSALERKAPLQDAVKSSQSALELIRRRYEAGTALVIEVLQAQSELAQVESSIVNNAIDISNYQASLDAARGSL